MSAAPPSLPASGAGEASGPNRRAATFRLTAEARFLLAHLSRSRGISQAAVLEVLIREAAARAR